MGLGVTAKMTAAARAFESERSDRLLADPLAAALAGEQGRALMREWRLPGTPVENPTLAARTRFYDDLLLASVAHGARQIVLLGAGMDTRAFRLELPADAVVFELDEPGVLEDKEAVLTREAATPRSRRAVVAVDLNDRGWPQTLLAAGFDPSAASFFSVEALSWCLTQDQVSALLDALASLATPESVLGIDMLSADYLRNPALIALLPLATSLGVYWRFGTNDPVRFLAEHGWRARRFRVDELARRHGRWPPAGVDELAADRGAAAAPDYALEARPVGAGLRATASAADVACAGDAGFADADAAPGA